MHLVAMACNTVHTAMSIKRCRTKRGHSQLHRAIAVAQGDHASPIAGAVLPLRARGPSGQHLCRACARSVCSAQAETEVCLGACEAAEVKHARGSLGTELARVEAHVPPVQKHWFCVISLQAQVRAELGKHLWRPRRCRGRCWRSPGLWCRCRAPSRRWGRWAGHWRTPRSRHPLPKPEQITGHLWSVRGWSPLCQRRLIVRQS